MKAKLGLTDQVYSSLVMLFISLISNPCVDNQKVNRDTVSTQKNPCVLRKFLCRHRKILVYSGNFRVDTGSTHVMSAILK